MDRTRVIITIKIIVLIVLFIVAIVNGDVGIVDALLRTLITGGL